MRVELELKPTDDSIAGRFQRHDGSWQQFMGWSQLAAEVEQLRQVPEDLGDIAEGTPEGSAVNRDGGQSGD